MNQLNVSVVNADLRMSSYPLLLGHFKEDEIINSEKVLNQNWHNYLEDLFEDQQYPTELEKNHVHVDLDLNPMGIVITGLGESRLLSAYTLSKSVEVAVKRFSNYIKRNYSDDKYSKYNGSISSLCIGSGYGNLTVYESLIAIIAGIVNANKDIEKTKGLQIIKNVEFVENINHKASNIYATIFQLQRNKPHLELKLDEKGVISKYGRKRSTTHEKHKKRWHVLSSELIESKNDENKFDLLKLRSNSGYARIEEEIVLFDKQLLTGINSKGYWEPQESKALFERLIPNQFKKVLRSQVDVILQVDKYSAEIPWELLQANPDKERPTFVDTGLIRQLITKDFSTTPKILRSNKALVIGNPIYEEKENLASLQETKKETENLVRKLRDEKFDVEPLIGNTGDNNYKAILNYDCKVLHIGAHGKYTFKDGHVGIALGSGYYFGPQDFKHRSVIPEFVFINTCFSGAIHTKQEEYSQKQFGMAANIGTQLIENGVEAVIVAGWAVKDSAAKFFSELLYDELLAGYTFGEAVKKARQQCFESAEYSLTWAAYQCYGNPGYRLVKKVPKPEIEDVYILEEDVIIELENILSSTRDSKSYTVSDYITRLEKCITKAKNSGYLTSAVIELQAKIYQDCGMLEDSLAAYEKLLEQEKALFSVKSLEQYCNVFAKTLVMRSKENSSNVSEDDKQNLIKKLDSLAFIGVTAERYNLQGSGFKRLAFIEENSVKSAAYLKLMKDRYEEGYKILENDLQGSIYPLTNWYTGIAITNPTTTQKAECLRVLNDKADKFSDGIITGKNFWKDINVVNLLMCRMLFLDSSNANYINALKLIKIEILENYSVHWKKAGNIRHLQAEMEHIEVLIKFVEEERLKSQLIEIRNTLNKKCN